MRKEVIFSYLDLKYNPDFPVDRSILPGFPSKPKDVLQGFVKTENVLWFFESEKNLPTYLGTNWDGLKPVMVEWFNNRFSKEHGEIVEIFSIENE
jgi:hypothetical protein